MSSRGLDAVSEVLFTFIDSSVKHANLLTDCSRGVLFTCCLVQNPPLLTLLQQLTQRFLQLWDLVLAAEQWLHQCLP
jgi:hypothetical protein